MHGGENILPRGAEPTSGYKSIIIRPDLFKV